MAAPGPAPIPVHPACESWRFPSIRRTILKGEAATEASLKRLGHGQTILHFTVHGLIDDSRPLESALVLAEGDGEDG